MIQQKLFLPYHGTKVTHKPGAGGSHLPFQDILETEIRKIAAPGQPRQKVLKKKS
jgi:hypothetical protein